MSKVKKEVVESKRGSTLEWTVEEKKNIPPQYGCEILVENASLEQIKDPSFPTDAYIVEYEVDGNRCIDLCRGSKRSNIFDLYYDKFGKGSIVSIRWGNGKLSPRNWNYTAPEKKKRR
jgi:hypothetical protein